MKIISFYTITIVIFASTVFAHDFETDFEGTTGNLEGLITEQYKVHFSLKNHKFVDHQICPEEFLLYRDNGAAKIHIGPDVYGGGYACIRLKDNVYHFNLIGNRYNFDGTLRNISIKFQWAVDSQNAKNTKLTIKSPKKDGTMLVRTFPLQLQVKKE